MDTDKVKIWASRMKVSSPKELAELEKAERDRDEGEGRAHQGSRNQLLYQPPTHLQLARTTLHRSRDHEHRARRLRRRGAFGTGHGRRNRITFDHPEQVKLGHCDLIEEVIIGEDTLIKFSGVAAGQACTIVLRGATEQLLDEAERSLHDALAVLSRPSRSPA